MKTLTLLFLIISFNSFSQDAINPVLSQYLHVIKLEAQKESVTFSGFSAVRGKNLYLQKFNHKKKPTSRSCATCHKTNPLNEGRTRAGKTIEAMMPINKNKRFNNLKKIKKWFRRNCKWTTGKVCTAQQKGDFITYLTNGSN